MIDFGYLGQKHICEAYENMLKYGDMTINEMLGDVFKVRKFTDKKGDSKACIYGDKKFIDDFAHNDMFKKHGIIFSKYSKHHELPIWSKKSARYNVEKSIRPFLMELSKETGEDISGLDTIIENLIREIEKCMDSDTNDTDRNNLDDLKQKLENFKIELMQMTDSEEFKDRIKKILDFSTRLRRNSVGRFFSFANCLLIYMQDPKATCVAGYKVWKNTYHRIVNSGTKMLNICIACAYNIRRQRQNRSNTMTQNCRVHFLDSQLPI